MAETKTFTAEELKEYSNMVVKTEREECAKVADSHKGAAAASRRDKGMKFGEMEDGAVVEISAEERGEDIAAEIIAAAIRART